MYVYIYVWTERIWKYLVQSYGLTRSKKGDNYLFYNTLLVYDYFQESLNEENRTHMEFQLLCQNSPKIITVMHKPNVTT